MSDDEMLRNFQMAANLVRTAKVDVPSDSDKLKLYGLYKVANRSPVPASPPSSVDRVGVAKWAAWKEAASQHDAHSAMREYAESVMRHLET